MRHSSLFAISAALVAAAPAFGAVTLDRITEALAAVPCWSAEVDYSVSMPQMLDDIIYRVDLQSMEAPGDTLAPCSYLIDWKLDTSDKPSIPGAVTSTGFSAYDNGHHYRYTSGRRLQEYHMDWDSIPFIPRLAGSAKAVAVQRSARFVELLPQMLAAKFKEMQADPAYTFTIHPDTTVAGKRGCVVVDMRRLIRRGAEYAQEGEYVFDGTTLMPLRIEMENNPGTIGEQTVTARYTPTDTGCERPTEQSLASRYPEVFEKWRESNYRIETLPGHRLPEFSLPTPEGSRYSRAAADPLGAPTVIVVYDPDDSFTANTIAAVRSALAQLPVAAEAIYAAMSSNAERVGEVIPELLPGERSLMSARSLARDCGVASTPTVIIADRNGIVTDVIVGYNADMATSISQRMSLMR